MELLIPAACLEIEITVACLYDAAWDPKGKSPQRTKLIRACGEAEQGGAGVAEAWGCRESGINRHAFQRLQEQSRGMGAVEAGRFSIAASRANGDR